MSGVITIRNLDDSVKEWIKAEARGNQRSMEAEIRALLTQAALSGKDEPKDFIWALDRYQDSLPVNSDPGEDWLERQQDKPRGIGLFE